MINKTLVSDFSKIIGNIEIAIQLDSFRNVREDYKMILDKLIQWIKYYYNNENFEIITYEESLKIHELTPRRLRMRVKVGYYHTGRNCAST